MKYEYWFAKIQGINLYRRNTAEKNRIFKRIRAR